ncbi:unnamed protein product, partial [Mycena citricolor]
AETPAEPVIMKDDEGKEEDVSASVEQAVVCSIGAYVCLILKIEFQEADAPVPEVASTPEESAPEPVSSLR